MTLFKDKFKTNSNRLENWDYSSEAVYFITIATENRKCIFGSIVEDKMILNDVGEIVEKELLKSIKIRKNWFFHNWIVMPNHIHLLIEIQNNDQILTTKYIVETHSSASTSSISTINIETSIVSHVAETHCCAPLQFATGQENKFKTSDSSLSRKPNSISSFVALFKSVTTKQINDLYKEKNTEIGNKKIWQTNYHDHIVRNYKRFETIYNYIKSNPGSWEKDYINLNSQ